MSADSHIEWTEHTFNPWHGCQKVSPGCKNCYAEMIDKRFGNDCWDNSPRKMMSEQYWRGPELWNKRAVDRGRMERVFCASMADVFEDLNDLLEPRARLFSLIERTPNLMWLLLTKRPENFHTMHPESWDYHGWPKNICAMTSAEDQERFDERIDALSDVQVGHRGLSLEPLLGPIDLMFRQSIFVDWVIVGGESGKNARPMNPEWARSLQRQCIEAGVPFFFKQWGEWAPDCLCSTKKAHRTIERPSPGSRGVMFRCGKNRAGRQLDGWTWDEHPFSLVASR